MKVAVWDTYVNRKDGVGVMHFDILVPDWLEDRSQIEAIAREYLASKQFETDEFTMERCLFCHVEQVTAQVEQEIEQFGYSIIELSNCQ